MKPPLMNENEISLSKLLAEDLAANRRNSKGRFVVINYRLANWALRNRRSFVGVVLGVPFLVWYRLVVNWLLGVEINASATIGGGLEVYHGYGLVVGPDCVLGSRVVLRQGVTIGNRNRGGGSPRLGNDVQVGANAVILGDIEVRDGAAIGAGAVVLVNVPCNGKAVGNPARVIQPNESNSNQRAEP